MQLKVKYLVLLTQLQLLLLLLLNKIRNLVKIPDYLIYLIRDLVLKKADYDAQIKDIKDKYFTTSDYDKFMNNILDEKIIAKMLVKDMF